jgi:hypothetical protein
VGENRGGAAGMGGRGQQSEHHLAADASPISMRFIGVSARGRRDSVTPGADLR